MTSYRIWTVSAISRKTGHPSRVTPFANAEKAAIWCEEHRPTKDWKAVKITSLKVKG
jgi:hypothetical protein